jgi:hypothetical protein
MTSLTERLRRALHDLDNHCTAVEREHYYATIVAHIRNAAPMLLAAAPPLGDAVADPEAIVVRQLSCGGWYEIEATADSVRFYVREQPEHDAAVSLNPVEVTRLRHDLDAVASGVGDEQTETLAGLHH